jgi:hypothetical protein
MLRKRLHPRGRPAKKRLKCMVEIRNHSSHFTLYTLHFTHFTLDTPCTSHYTHFTLYTSHFHTSPQLHPYIFTISFKLCTSHLTLLNSHSTLYAPHCTIRTSQLALHSHISHTTFHIQDYLIVLVLLFTPPHSHPNFTFSLQHRSNRTPIGLQLSSLIVQDLPFCQVNLCSL